MHGKIWDISGNFNFHPRIADWSSTLNVGYKLYKAAYMESFTSAQDSPHFTSVISTSSCDRINVSRVQHCML